MNTKNFEKFSPIDFLKISEEINKYSDILKEQSLEDYIMLPFYMLENGYQKIMVTNLKVQQIIKIYLILLRSTVLLIELEIL